MRRGRGAEGIPGLGQSTFGGQNAPSRRRLQKKDLHHASLRAAGSEANDASGGPRFESSRARVARHTPGIGRIGPAIQPNPNDPQSFSLGGTARWVREAKKRHSKPVRGDPRFPTMARKEPAVAGEEFTVACEEFTVARKELAVAGWEFAGTDGCARVARRSAPRSRR